MLDKHLYLNALNDRIETIRRMLDAAHPPPTNGHDVSREVRGLAIVLLFAAYEHLIKSLCRGILETTRKLRVGNWRLKPGIRAFAIHGDLVSIKDSPERSKIWKRAPDLIKVATNSRRCTVNTSVFPDDGSFMKASQVQLICELFGLGDPAPILKNAWDRIDGIVAQRNSIAHGHETPEEVGRLYTVHELRHLATLWQLRWTEFVEHVCAATSNRDFFRH